MSANGAAEDLQCWAALYQLDQCRKGAVGTFCVMKGCAESEPVVLSVRLSAGFCMDIPPAAILDG